MVTMVDSSFGCRGIPVEVIDRRMAEVVATVAASGLIPNEAGLITPISTRPEDFWSPSKQSTGTDSVGEICLPCREQVSWNLYPLSILVSSIS